MSNASDFPSGAPALDLTRRFYAGFSRCDGEAMAACYASEARFADPAFGELSGADPGRMWRMLCSQARDLHVTLDRAEPAGRHGALDEVTAQWTATYTFSATGRKVVNVVTSRLRIDPVTELIVWQEDDFDFWRWSRQALGPVGWLLGWTPLLRAKVQGQARAGLAKWRPR